MITLVHCKDFQPNDPDVLYCGRAWQGWEESPFHNPCSRRGQPCPVCNNVHVVPGESIVCFRQYLFRELSCGRLVTLLLNIPSDAKLGCWCVPKPCHTEVIRAAHTWLKANPPIMGFKGDYSFLSNIRGPARVALEGVEYPSVENAYQAAKYPATEREVFTTISPWDAKKRSIPYDRRLLLPIMRDLVQQKFAQSPYREQLEATGQRLIIEANQWGDRWWGTCKDEGENHLGRIIMDIRRARRTPPA